jgi:hypothetical protein
MLQPQESLPEVRPVPAPWALRGQAWIVLLRLPRAAAAARAFVPPPLLPSLRTPVSVLMCVDYVAAPCGPYRELLFIPGAMRFPDGRHHPSISRILVSTWESVVNGRANWGIPKDRADFEFEAGPAGDRIRVTDAGREVCRIDFGPARGPRLPLTTSLLPARLATLAQWHAGQAFYYRPQARGSLRLCRLRDWQFDPQKFPDLSGARVLACLRIERFDMTFPVARVEQPGELTLC